MSVSILYYKVSQEKMNSVQLSAQISSWLGELPENKQQQVKKLHSQNDQILSLAGLQLLKHGIADYISQDFPLSDIRFPRQGKPFLNENIDFNISHSGDIVVCIISDNLKVGIDIELQRPISDATMNKYLEGEIDKNPRNFFDLWTKKEAIIKAANIGSIYNMKEINLDKHGGHYQNQYWYNYTINMSATHDKNKYTCHIACSDNVSKIDVNKIELN